MVRMRLWSLLSEGNKTSDVLQLSNNYLCSKALQHEQQSPRLRDESTAQHARGETARTSSRSMKTFLPPSRKIQSLMRLPGSRQAQASIGQQCPVRLFTIGSFLTGTVSSIHIAIKKSTMGVLRTAQSENTGFYAHVEVKIQDITHTLQSKYKILRIHVTVKIQDFTHTLQLKNRILRTLYTVKIYDFTRKNTSCQTYLCRRSILHSFFLFS